MVKPAKRIVIAMSGGVDSALSAALLVDAGYDVIGVAMRLWEAEAGATASGCCSLDDFLDARLVAEKLRIPFYVMDFADEFRRSVVDNFVAEYRLGRTPNPCTRCNQFVKFGSLWERARELGADLVATGHYARLVDGPAGPSLLRGADRQKDQSYFLFSVGRDLLPRVLFPVGSYRKDEVRLEAARRGLPVADKPDSQDVCFAPRGTYASFVEQYRSTVPLRPGDLRDETGTVLGRHSGVHRFTIGQRRGLGVSSGGEPRYVTAIEAETGTVRVGSASQVTRGGLVATAANWLARLPERGASLTLKIRSRFEPEPVRVVHAAQDRFAVLSDRGLRAVTAGQAAVLYDGERVIGGGWIERPIGDESEVAVSATGEGGYHASAMMVPGREF